MLWLIGAASARAASIKRMIDRTRRRGTSTLNFEAIGGCSIELLLYSMVGSSAMKRQVAKARHSGAVRLVVSLHCPVTAGLKSARVAVRRPSWGRGLTTPRNFPVRASSRSGQILSFRLPLCVSPACVRGERPPATGGGPPWQPAASDPSLEQAVRRRCRHRPRSRSRLHRWWRC